MLSDGSLIVVGVALLGLFGVGVGLRALAGSEIGKHPSAGLSHTGGAAAPKQEVLASSHHARKADPIHLTHTAPDRRRHGGPGCRGRSP
jgi:hypothetical protein